MADAPPPDVPSLFDHIRAWFFIGLAIVSGAFGILHLWFQTKFARKNEVSDLRMDLNEINKEVTRSLNEVLRNQSELHRMLNDRLPPKELAE